MTSTKTKSTQIDLFDQKKYRLETPEDEVRVDQLCKQLLQEYHQYLLNNKEFSPLEAGSMASGADYYLRDFMIDNRRTNIFQVSPELIQNFAGNWYILNTLEPNMVELESILTGTSHFYRFCVEKHVISSTTAENIDQACSRLDYYRQRIESFHNLTGDGFTAWKSACPLQ